MQKLLIVKLGALGDVYDSTLYLEYLSKTFDVSFMVLDSYAVPLEQHNNTISIIRINSNSRLSIYFYIIKALVKGRWDYISVFQLRRSLVYLIKFLCPSSKVESLRNFLPVICHQKVSRVNLELMVLRKLTSNQLLTSSMAIHWQPYPIRSTKIPVVAIAIGGGNRYDDAKNRILDINFLTSLISEIIRQYGNSINIYLLGHGDADEKRVEVLSTMLEANGTHPSLLTNYVGKTSYDNLLTILKDSILFIGADSFISKIASIHSAKAFIYLGPTSPYALRYPSDNQVLVTPNEVDVPCAPCHNPCRGQKSSMFTCRENICMNSHSIAEPLLYLSKVI